MYLVCFLMLFILPAITKAYDVTEKLSLEGTLTGVYQYRDFDIKGLSDADRGTVVFDLGVNFHPTEFDEFQVIVSAAAGNGLNSVNPFQSCTICR